MADLTIIHRGKAAEATNGLIELTNHLQESVAKTHAFLEERFGCWGDDETGKAFADQYLPNYQRFWDQSKELNDGLASSADDLRQVQKRFTEADEHNADNLR